MCEERVKKYYTEAESRALFSSLFPLGFAGDDVVEEIAPEGWPDSTLLFVFHPTVEQVHWERVQLHRNLMKWPWLPKALEEEPEPSLADVRAEFQDSSVDIVREVRELVAKCLWDVFSNENDVIDRAGRLVDIGSWRGTAGFLADELNRECGKQHYDYMDFYMGSFEISQRADLTPVYEMIFRRLKNASLDWRYRIPQLRLIEFPADKPDGRKSHEIEKMRVQLEQAHRAALEALKLEPVPAIVLACSNVYGAFPPGWPPWDCNPGQD